MYPYASGASNFFNEAADAYPESAEKSNEGFAA